MNVLLMQQTKSSSDHVMTTQPYGHTCPTRRSPFLVKATTDGVVRAPSALVMTVGLPPSMAATAELVVPRSIPTTCINSTNSGMFAQLPRLIVPLGKINRCVDGDPALHMQVTPCFAHAVSPFRKRCSGLNGSMLPDAVAFGP